MSAGVACALAALVLGGGSASRHVPVVVQDDGQLLYAGPAAADRAVRRLGALGADGVRLTANWSAIAPAATSPVRPGPPFAPRDSRTYPREGLARLDHAVAAAAGAGLRVQIDVAFWAPRWAVARAGPRPDRERYAPDPTAFGAFTAALARRYSGRFPDPARPGRRLPVVRLWTAWNEPNNPDFLEPQWEAAKHGFRPASPHVYRRLHEAAYAALKRADPRNRVLLGGTAPNGRDSGPGGGVRPLRFLRELACVDGHLRPLHVPECSAFEPLRADGYAQHPYSLRTAPGAPDPHADDVRLADLGRLHALLDVLAARGRIARRLPIDVTEYGYESDPPDPYAPFDAATQARFLGQASFLAWATPGVASFAQFLLRDVAPGGAGGRPGSRRWWSDFQTGLEDPAGRPKPAERAFELPFWAQAETLAGGHRAVVLFGAVRGHDGAEAVRVERRTGPGAPWQPATTGGSSCGQSSAEFLTGDGGSFLRAAPLHPGDYRLLWLRRDGPPLPSLTIPVGTAPQRLPRLPFAPSAPPPSG